MTAPLPLLDVLGLGQAALDRLLVVPRPVGPDEKVEGTGLTVQCGGPVATALWALSRWGRSTAFAGVVGDDDAGAAIRADLVRGGVDVQGLLVRPGTASQQAFIAVEQGSGARQILWQRPTGCAPGASEVAWRPARCFLTDGLFAEASLALARRAPRVIVDAGTMREGTRALLDVAHVFVASESFARDLVGADDPVGACRAIRERGARIAGVTLGARGHVALVGRRVLVRGSWPVAVVDTTGCGDVFHAGLVEGLLRGWSPARALDLGAWAAGRCATRIGARAGIPDRAELEALGTSPPVPPAPEGALSPAGPRAPARGSRRRARPAGAGPGDP